jgi:hypothetical protein
LDVVLFEGLSEMDRCELAPLVGIEDLGRMTIPNPSPTPLF